MLVARFVTVTVAPGTAACCSSSTVPSTRPVCSCAESGALANEQNATSRATPPRSLFSMVPSTIQHSGEPSVGRFRPAVNLHVSPARLRLNPVKCPRSSRRLREEISTPMPIDGSRATRHKDHRPSDLCGFRRTGPDQRRYDYYSGRVDEKVPAMVSKERHQHVRFEVSSMQRGCHRRHCETLIWLSLVKSATPVPS